jgi:hypothetical protein
LLKGQRSAANHGVLAAAAAVLFMGCGVAARGEEVHLDRHCQPASDSYRVDYRRTVIVHGVHYWFSLARYQDGSAIFCLTRPNYTQGRLLAAEPLQRQFIREIRQEERDTSFLITVAYGNGRAVPLVQFRLNLKDPLKPELVRVREWRDSP